MDLQQIASEQISRIDEENNNLLHKHEEPSEDIENEETIIDGNESTEPTNDVENDNSGEVSSETTEDDNEENLLHYLTNIPFVAVMQGKDGPVVNLYNAGMATARTASGGDVRLVAAGDLLDTDGWRLSVNPSRKESFTVYLRIPAWSERTKVSVNGEDVRAVVPGRYLELSRNWSTGDVVSVAFDFKAKRLMAPHGANRAGDGYQAVVWGPIVLVRDENTDPAYSDPVMVEADTAGNVDVKRIAPTYPGHRLEFRVPTDAGDITMCDYASVDGWTGKRIQTWLPLRNRVHRVP